MIEEAETVQAALRRITREAMRESLYESVVRPSPFEFSEGRLVFRSTPWWRPPLYRLRRRLRNAWWALRDYLPDEDNWTEWL